MPEISRFYGIIVRMYFNEHNPPHFHVSYDKRTAVIEINGLAILRGELPPHAVSLVTEWATIHKKELLEAWESARKHQVINKIAPLE